MARARLNLEPLVTLAAFQIGDRAEPKLDAQGNTIKLEAEGV